MPLTANFTREPIAGGDLNNYHNYVMQQCRRNGEGGLSCELSNIGGALDAASSLYDLCQFQDGADPNLIGGGISVIHVAWITLYRRTAGVFDGATFDSVGFNRGYVYIEYET